MIKTVSRFSPVLALCVLLSSLCLIAVPALGEDLGFGEEKFKVGVLGYPNTGKSSIINALKGRASAPTSPVSGYTKGMQWIRASKRMYLLDPPGVFPD